MKCPHCGKETAAYQSDQQQKTDMEFLLYAFHEVYPKRSGGQRWPQADLNFKALVKKGVDPEKLILKAREYAGWCLANKTESPFVMQAATFLGRGGGWQEDWSTETSFDAARRQLQEQT